MELHIYETLSHRKASKGHNGGWERIGKGTGKSALGIISTALVEQRRICENALSQCTESISTPVKSAGKSLVSGSLSSTVYLWAWTSTIGYSVYWVRFHGCRSLMLQCMFSQHRNHFVCHRQSAGVAFDSPEAFPRIREREKAHDWLAVCSAHGTGQPPTYHPALSNCNRCNSGGMPPDLWSFISKLSILLVAHLPSRLRKALPDGRGCNSPSREESERGSEAQNITATKMQTLSWTR